jgi:hypothetical protein
MKYPYDEYWYDSEEESEEESEDDVMTMKMDGW